MKDLTKALKRSVGAAKNGTLKKDNGLYVAVDLPEGVAVRKDGSFVLPPSPARRADLLYATQQLRYGLQHQVDRLAKLEGELKEFFINTLGASDATGIAGQRARVQIETRPVPQVEDWDRLYAYVARHQSWELLQRRLGEAAAKELLEAGEGGRAGLTVVRVKKVSVTKL